jgi:beta-glucosidase
MKVIRWLFRILPGLAAVYLVVIAVFEFSESEPVFKEIPQDAGVSTLPPGFLLGAATSAHQVEGGNVHNDWAAFEAVPGNIREGQASGLAADHWNRVAEDVGLLQDLGANAYRFSLEWSRLEPEEGRWDEQAWAHYADEIEQLRSAGIEPMVTLLHFTLPQWLAEQGGLTAPDFAEHFGRFAGEAARRLGSSVNLWCTVNEPNVQMYQSYVQGVWPPGVRDTAQASLAFAGLVRGHAAAANAIRANDPDSSIGAAVNLILFEPDRHWWALDWVAAREADKGFNWAFYDSIASGSISFHLAGFPEIEEPLEGLAGSADWFGINYYRRNLVRFTPSAPGLVTLLQGPGPLSDSGVEMYPEGLLQLTRRVWERYGLPIHITENGVADSDGDLRPDFLRSHLYAVSQAVDEGIPVEGYYHWSLMDNFEWAEGYQHRFGLYTVDFDTLERRPGPAVAAFRDLAKELGPREWESE